MRDLLGEDDKISTEKLLAELPKMEDRPWAEYKNDKPITARGISSLLRRFDGVKPKTVRQGTTLKGYSRELLAPAFKRYLPAPIPSAESVTSVTPLANSLSGIAVERVTDIATAERSEATSSVVTDVTDRNHGVGPHGQECEPDETQIAVFDSISGIRGEEVL